MSCPHSGEKKCQNSSNSEGMAHNNCSHPSSHEHSHSHQKHGHGHGLKHVGVEGLLGCGNSTAIEALQPGQTVLDLGSGGGLDCISAAKKVGPTGHVIGVDSNPDMIETAKQACITKGFDEKMVQFKLGEIENIPVEDGIVDVVISSFAVNHSRDKQQVFNEAARVLKRGGNLAIADVIATTALSENLRTKLKEINSCMSESDTADTLKASILAAGFENVTITVNESSRHLLEKMFKVEGMGEYVAMANICARKS